jgi:hypothetical protein
MGDRARTDPRRVGRPRRRASTSDRRNGGWLFKHTGDGVCAAFASPHGAIDAAITAQRHLAIPVRMGIASGEAHETDGDYLGPVLNRVARVTDAGHGGQILVAASTAALVDSVDLLDLGEHRLRDLTVPTRACRCVNGLAHCIGTKQLLRRGSSQQIHRIEPAGSEHPPADWSWRWPTTAEEQRDEREHDATATAGLVRLAGS